MPTLMPGASWLPISQASGNYRPGGIDLANVRMYVPHIAVGNGSLRGFFNTPKAPAQKASAHGWVGRDGTSEQYVSLTDTAYAVGNWNTVSVSWESEGYPDDPLTDAQLNVHAANLVALRALGCPIDLAVNSTDQNGSGVTPHCILGGQHTCPNPDGNRPGPIEAQYPLIVARAIALEGGTTASEDDPLFTPDDSKHLTTVTETVSNTQNAVGRIEVMVYALAHQTGGAGTSDAGLIAAIQALPAATVAAIKAAL